MTAREELNEAKITLGVSTDPDLADILGTNKRNIESWVKRNSIPDKWRMVLSHHLHPLAKLPLDETEEIKLNFYPEVSASAGYGAFNDNLESKSVTVSRFFIEGLRVQNIRKIDIIRIYGDSMEPDFKNGEYVVVERVDSIDEVNNGNTVIANIDGDMYIKKIEKIPFEKGIILNPTNNNYKPIKIEPHNLHEVNIVGIVRGIIDPR